MSDRHLPPTALTEAGWLGTVVAVQANFYRVQIDRAAEPPKFSLLCTRRTRLKKIGQQVMVGDRVVVEEPDWEGERGAISDVLPRRTELDRPPVANADCVLLVFALAEPSIDPIQLSRFLIKAESTQLDVQLCLNKSDLVGEEEREQWRDRLRQWGYDPLLLSVRTAWGVDDLARRLRDRVTILAGPSGVGKSSTIDRLVPAADVRVAGVSGKLKRGRHTTRHVELFELPNGGLLADTPGFDRPELDCLPRELPRYFPEIQRRLDLETCQFSDCFHREEPNCAVRGTWERYDHYLMFVEEAIVRQEERQQLGDRESTLKLRTKKNGQRYYEPKLASKKYRRLSRRQQHQNLQELCEDLEDI
ncbi:MAG: small ribosomal subunit biogenesis GTPase RsgA [Cyanobacteria bacterium SID2]|nr:small ribosomal subunit biogenesis GTPase RsgA [Cyanobacteria bacterium SID2]MBP0004989.1 small ribosomal subunit biogenesis GTPase RsgA [Cyanobacteria bacterium SBC]